MLDEFIQKLKTKEGVTKWALTAGGFYAAYVFLWPIISRIIIDVTTGLVLAAIGLGIFYLIPAICEQCAQWGWYLYEKAIRNDPLSRMRRDEQASAKEIDNYERDVSNANANIGSAEEIYRKQKPLLAPDEVAMFEEQLQTLYAAREQLIARRNDLIRDHQAFVRAIERAEAKYRIGKAFTSAAGAMAFNKKFGATSQGARIAMDEVDRQLAESHARLQTSLSRPRPVVAAASVSALPSGSRTPLELPSKTPVGASSDKG